MAVTNQIDSVERLLTLKEAASELGIPYWKLLRASNAGLIPTYTLLNSRRLVRLSEINRVIENSSLQGGAHG